LNRNTTLVLLLTILILFCTVGASAKTDQIPLGKVLIINESNTDVVFYLRKGASEEWSKFTLRVGAQKLYLYKSSKEILVITNGLGRVLYGLRDGQRYKIYVNSHHQLDVKMLNLN